MSACTSSSLSSTTSPYQFLDSLIGAAASDEIFELDSTTCCYPVSSRRAWRHARSQPVLVGIAYRREGSWMPALLWHLNTVPCSSRPDYIHHPPLEWRMAGACCERAYTGAFRDWRVVLYQASVTRR